MEKMKKLSREAAIRRRQEEIKRKLNKLIEEVENIRDEILDDWEGSDSCGEATEEERKAFDAWPREPNPTHEEMRGLLENFPLDVIFTEEKDDGTRIERQRVVLENGEKVWTWRIAGSEFWVQDE